jgi:hypothetical protein
MEADYGEDGEEEDRAKSEAGSNYFDEDSDDESFLVKQDMAGIVHYGIYIYSVR